MGKAACLRSSLWTIWCCVVVVVLCWAKLPHGLVSGKIVLQMSTWWSWTHTQPSLCIPNATTATPHAGQVPAYSSSQDQHGLYRLSVMLQFITVTSTFICYHLACLPCFFLPDYSVRKEGTDCYILLPFLPVNWTALRACLTVWRQKEKADREGRFSPLLARNSSNYWPFSQLSLAHWFVNESPALSLIVCPRGSLAYVLGTKKHRDGKVMVWEHRQ